MLLSLNAMRCRYPIEVATKLCGSACYEFLGNIWDILFLETSKQCSSVAMSRRSLGGLPTLVVRWPPVPVRWRFEGVASCVFLEGFCVWLVWKLPVFLGCCSGWWRQLSYCCRTWKQPWCFVLASWPTATTDGTWRCSSQSWMLITVRSRRRAVIRMERAF